MCVQLVTCKCGMNITKVFYFALSRLRLTQILHLKKHFFCFYFGLEFNGFRLVAFELVIFNFGALRIVKVAQVPTILSCWVPIGQSGIIVKF